MWGGPARTRTVPVALLFALAVPLLLSACAGSGYHYVKSSVQDAYLKVPSEWKLYDHKELVSLRTDLSEEQRDAVLDTSWTTAFDSSPDPSLKHVLQRAAHPAGLALIVPLSPKDSDSVSDGSLRNFFFDVDAADSDDRLTILDYSIVDRDGGFHGIHLVARMVLGEAASAQAYQGKAITFDQTVLVDQERQRVYGVAVACSAKCYERNHEKITNIVDSWTVKEAD
jgi:hypothetical protein